MSTLHFTAPITPYPGMSRAPLVPPTPLPSPLPTRVKLNYDIMKSDVDLEDNSNDTRPKLDPSLLEHTSFMRAAIPVLKVPLATFCLIANILIPGLGTILSGLFCLCFGIPRFGVHDGAKYRIGGLLVNLIVGCFQLFTVIFCLVGWGWSIWWGVIMLRLARKYRKLKQEAKLAMEEDPSSSPPHTDGNHAPLPA